MKLSKILITLSIIAGISYSCNRDETTTATDAAAKQEMIQTESTSDFVTDDNSEVAMDFASAFESVSYTHLDVYKRQGFSCFCGALLVMAFPVCKNSATTFPVSYTHLDVYKRQCKYCIRSICNRRTLGS